MKPLINTKQAVFSTCRLFLVLLGLAWMSLSSASAQLGVSASITTHPASVTIATGYTATLTVSAAGFPVPTFQWYQGDSGDTSTPVGTSSSFTTPALTTTTSYWVRATNSGGSADSNAAVVTVTTGPASINLANYVRISRFNLPEYRRTALPAGTPAHNLLCDEASAVTYNWDTDTLFITGDGGRAITQVSKTGQLIDTMTLALGSSPQGTDFYDPEGLTYIGGGQFVMSEERDRQLVKFTYVAGATLSRSGAQTVKIGTFVDNIGTEGLSWDPQTSGFICLKEISPIGIFQTGVDFVAGTATNGSPTTVNSTNLFDPALLGMTDTADVFALSNLPSMTGQPQAGNLLVIGQEDARIVNVDRSGNIHSTLNISSDPGNPLTPAGQQHEGITMDRAGIIYVVNENGGGSIEYPQLWVYAPATQPNQAPTSVIVDNAVNTLPENSSTASRVKLGDIIVTDDGLGTNTLSLSGADAASFELTGNEFFLKAGVILDFETKSSYAVTVNVDDSTVGTTPDASVNFTLNLGDVEPEAPPAPVIIISEVAPWASGSSAVGADWFEITNVTSNPINISGWKIDDNSASFASAATLNGVTTLAAGESVIFIETTDLPGKAALFSSTWFGANPPAGLQVGSYTGSGLGLGTSGDAVNIYNAAGTLMASVTFGASDAVSPYQTFDNTRGLNATTISQLSAVGTNGAIASGNAAEVGSPGFAAPGVLRITEVAAWGSGNGNYLADWFEVTNTGARAVGISGWKMDDSSESPAAALSLTGVTSIAPGESVIFMETATPVTTIATFRSTWFGASPPAALQIGSYTGSGAGLSTGGDAVVLYDGNNVRQAKVFFGASPSATPFATFDNSTGADNVNLATLSAVGTNGAFVALTDTDEIGSPGATTSSTFSFASATYSVNEAGASVTLTVNRTGGTYPATVLVSTANGTATAGTDYTALSSAPVAFALDEMSRTVTVYVAFRSGLQGSRAFTATLSGATTVSPSTTTITITDADTFGAIAGPSSSKTPYVQPLLSNWQTTSLLTVGDQVAASANAGGTPLVGGKYEMAGIPDGLGAFDNGDGTLTLLMHHEINSTLGVTRAHGSIGGFISEWIIHKSTLQVLSGSDLIRSIYGWNTSTQSSNAAPLAPGAVIFNRFCSADLPAPSALYNAATGLGTQERVFLGGEESGSNGWALATVASGANKGSSYVLGKFNLTTNGSGLTGVGGWENLLASPFAQDKTVVIGTNDGGTGIMANAVAVYVGTKTNAGSEADKAGLTNGTLKFINVTGSTVEIANSTTRATNITSGTAFTLSGTSSTVFSRPEDGAWDPTTPGRFYFVTTDRLDQVNDGVGSQVGRTRLWRLNFTDITHPDLGGTIDIVLTGGEGNDANMWDNMCVTADGKLMLQEDVGGTAHNGKVWFYDPVTNALTKVLKHDSARFGDVVSGSVTTATAPFNNDEESSGVIDVTTLFGGNPATGGRIYLLVSQAHYAAGMTAAQVEGGQLLLVRQEGVSTGPSTTATPYLRPLHGAWQATSLLTVGDSIGGYSMTGIPDGLGAYDNGDGTVTLLMNHELGNSVGAVRAHGAAGAFVSEWVINKSTLAVVSGSDLIRTIYGWDVGSQATGSALAGAALNRLCSADLPAVTAFYNSASGLGTQTRLFMSGEEGGSNGWALAHVARGPEKGRSYVLGRFNLATNGSGVNAVGGWENLLASPYEQDKTIVVGLNDGGTGLMNNRLNVYVGTKTASGNEADKAGLNNGQLYFVNVAANAAEIVNSSTRATGITSGTRFTLDSAGGTQFSRPEDGAWDPTQPGRFYFVTTDRLDQVADGVGSQIGRTRLWSLVFDDITHPEQGGVINLLATGGEGNDANMWDNLGVTRNGRLLLQEDVGGAPHNGKVWFYDPVTQALTKVLKHDPARFGDISNGYAMAATTPFSNDEESSGILDVSDLFDVNASTGERAYLAVVQAHYALASPLVEGGQLLLLREMPAAVEPLVAPSDIALSSTRIREVNPADTVVGTLSATDANSADSHRFTLVSGAGDDDNASFRIEGGSLRILPVTNAALKGSYQVRIRATDDSNSVLSLEKAFTITVTPLGAVSLASASFNVSASASSVDVTVVRVAGSTAASVTLATTDGSASTVPPFAAATAGVDYVAGSTVVSFAEGETSRSASISLLPRTGASVPNRRFNVTLSAPTDGVGLGAITTAEVRILAADTLKPSLVVTTPAASVTLLSAASPFQVKGIAGDVRGIDRVEVVLNGGTPVNAVLGSARVSTSVPWSLDIEPLPGANTLAVTAFDLRGNASATVTRSFTFSRRYVLSVSGSAPSALALAGGVTLAATPSAAVSALMPSTAGASPRTSSILPGTAVKLTATAKTGYWFSHWARQPASAVALGGVLTFTMPAEDVAAEAVFVANPLLVDSSGRGNGYYGLLNPFEGVAAGNDSVGFVVGTVTPATGGFSGKVMIGGTTTAVAGVFQGDGRFLYVLGSTRSWQGPLVGGRRLELVLEGADIRVNLRNAGDNAKEVTGRVQRAFYGTGRKLPAELLNRKVPATAAAENRGFLTVALPTKTQVPAKDLSSYPQGSGIGTVTWTDVGVVSFAGTLADGTPFTGSSGLVTSVQWPYYAVLATPGAAAAAPKGGSLSGVFEADVAQPGSDVTASGLLWIRPEVLELGGTTPGAKATQLYTAGWPEGIRVDAVGAFYNDALDVTSALGLGPVNAVTGNGELAFSVGKLVNEVRVSAFNIQAGATVGSSVVTKIPASNSSFTLVVNPKLGIWSGTFTPDWTQAAAAKPAFKGVLLQKGDGRGGYGWFISNRSADLDPESGQATLGAQAR